MLQSITWFQPAKDSDMPLVSMRQLLDHAAEHTYGIPAYNVDNLEQVQAVMQAAAEVGAPVILQASAGARKYAGEAFIKHLILAAIEQFPNVPLVMHQDHGQSPEICRGAIGLGFSSVMMDGSLEADGKTIASYDYNVEVTRKVVDMAHATGVTVEGGDRTWQRAHGGRQFIGAASSGRDAEVFDGLAGRWRRGRRGDLSVRRRQPAAREPMPGQRGRRHLQTHRIAPAGPAGGQVDAPRGHRRPGQRL